MAELILHLGLPVQLIHNSQQRHNFLFKGVEIAMKFSEDWGYHAELEIVVNKLVEKEDAEKRIRAVAKELGLNLMTEVELWEHTQKVQAKYKTKTS